MNIHEDSKQFLKNLFDFWNQKGISNLKVPQIGGRELDLQHLYKAVCKKGGFTRVCNNKLWKEIVNEFGLPPSCTSASFTLRNHYNKYLYSFEQKFFFGREDDGGNEDLPGSKPRKMIKTNEQHELRDIPHMTQQHPSTDQQGPSLRVSMQKMYNNYNKNSDVLFIKKYKMIPVVSELNRIMLAFESRIQDEITSALNSLLLYSVSTNPNNQFLLDQYPALLDNIINYIDEIIKNVPFLKKCILEDSKDTPQILLNVIENSNYPISDIMNQQKDVPPSEILNKLAEKMITNKYQAISEATLIENIRMIVHIFRNLSYIKSNEIILCKHSKIYKLLQNFFTDSMDQEITKDCLDIFANLCRNMQLKQIVNPDKFCERIYKYLESENYDEIESALDCLRHLIITPENEAILEGQIKSYLDNIIDLLIHPHVEIREIVLEFLCFLSDLKMNTRVVIAKHPKSILRLVALLISGTGKNGDKITKLSALILSNLSMAPAAKSNFLPYERDLFIIAASDESISKVICNILGELDNINPQLALELND